MQYHKYPYTYLLIITISSIIISLTCCYNNNLDNKSSPTEELITNLKSDDPGVRVNAFFALHDTDSAGIKLLLDTFGTTRAIYGRRIICEIGIDALPALIEILKAKQNYEFINRPIDSIGDIGLGDEEIYRLLFELLQEHSNNTDVVESICYSLFKLKNYPEYFIESLLELLENGNPMIKVAALFALSVNESARSEDIYNIILSDYNYNTNELLIPAFAYYLYNASYKQTEMLNIIIEHSHGEYLGSAYSIKALIYINNETANNTLMRMIFDENTSVILALIDAQHKPFEIKNLIHALHQVNDMQLKMLILDYIGMYSNPTIEDLNDLIVMLGDPYPDYYYNVLEEVIEIIKVRIQSEGDC